MSGREALPRSGGHISPRPQPHLFPSAVRRGFIHEESHIEELGHSSLFGASHSEGRAELSFISKQLFLKCLKKTPGQLAHKIIKCPEVGWVGRALVPGLRGGWKQKWGS